MASPGMTQGVEALERPLRHAPAFDARETAREWLGPRQGEDDLIVEAEVFGHRLGGGTPIQLAQ